ncbi:MAG: hypothetical protein KDA38_00880 [Planctomycetales bacterium]|nr:hypothetical protein [Planctomycetales bacterium]
MRESPRTRRLRTDLKALESLKADSSILDFSVPGPMFGGPPEVYLIRFNGRGLQRHHGADVTIRDQHELTIQLGASYPRMMPELHWKSPIFHPNISASGAVCLGGYGTHWVPSVNLDELCEMLWEMVRYRNFDVDSPYNREAALWAKTQTQFRFPVDDRPIRDRVASRAAAADSQAGAAPRIMVDAGRPAKNESPTVPSPIHVLPARRTDSPVPVNPYTRPHSPALPPASNDADDGIYILDDASDDEVVDAEIVVAEQTDILFLN